MKELICIVCPRGCHLKVDEELNVTGNFCPRGAEYAKAELTHPTRVLTSTVRLEGGRYSRCPVKTSAPIPRELMSRAVDELANVTLRAPVRIGDVAIADILGTGADLVVTRNIPEA